MKFWQKTYFLTLLLFLVCLNLGVFTLAYHTYATGVASKEAACRAEHDYIADSFERDYADLMAMGGTVDPILLMQSYGNAYRSQGISLGFFTAEGEWLYVSWEENETPSTSLTLSYQRVGGERHLSIGSELSTGHRFWYLKDVSDLDENYRSLVLTFLLVSVGVSLFLALTLYLVLKRLSAPLEALRQTADRIAGGDLALRAKTKGKDEVAMLGVSFNSMVERLEMQMTALEREAVQKQLLVDNMAHELRTPLTGVHGYAEYIEKAAVGEEEKIRAAKRILAEAERLQRISEKILDTACLASGQIVRKPLSLRVLLADTVERLTPIAHEKEIELCFEGEEVEITGDETLLSMLFYNLTENAIKASARGDRVVLSTEGRSALVTDHGKGMTEEQLSHITEPFYRTDKSRSRSEGGAGLGLPLCRRIVEVHGAEMTFHSVCGEGTVVRVAFTS